MKKDNELSPTSSPPQQQQRPDAFAFLMAHRTPTRTLPPRMAPARTKKDEGEPFVVSAAASASEIDNLWSELSAYDCNFEVGHQDKLLIKSLTPRLSEFFAHCCRERHYFFEIKKYGIVTCHICKPPRLSESEFEKLVHMPDPMPASDGHYKPFFEVAGKETSEQHRPSLHKLSQKEKHLLFYPSVATCEKCKHDAIV